VPGFTGDMRELATAPGKPGTQGRERTTIGCRKGKKRAESSAAKRLEPRLRGRPLSQPESGRRFTSERTPATAGNAHAGLIRLDKFRFVAGHDKPTTNHRAVTATTNVDLTLKCGRGPIRVRSPLAPAIPRDSAWDQTWLHSDKRRGHQLNLRRGNTHDRRATAPVNPPQHQAPKCNWDTPRVLTPQGASACTPETRGFSDEKNFLQRSVIPDHSRSRRCTPTAGHRTRNQPNHGNTRPPRGEQHRETNDRETRPWPPE
jgi:hypothetical protein